jgi:hypothetical protein
LPDWAIWQEILKQSNFEREQEKKMKLAEYKIEQQILALKSQKKRLRAGEGFVLGFTPAKRLRSNEGTIVHNGGPTIESLSEEEWNYELEEEIDLGF